MKRKVFKGATAMCLALMMCISAFAASISVNSYYPVFNSKNMSRGQTVSITQTYATATGVSSAAVRWVLYNKDAGISTDAVWLYGEDSGSVSAGAAANYRLWAYNGESSAVSFNYSLSY